MSTLVVAGLLGLGTAVGILLIVAGLTHRTPHHDEPEASAGRWTATLARWQARRRPGASRRLAACVAVGLVVAVWTRWPVAAILAGLATWILPALIGPDREHRNRLARIEAVATWTESLRDTLSAAAGLEQAIVATAVMAPTPIRAEVTRLADALRRGDRLADALRKFAVEVDDATADLVVTALVMAAERHARHIGELLTSLATAAQDQASLRMRVAAGRARVRTSTRVITLVTAAMAAGLVVLNRPYLHPYDTALGQLVLAVVGGCFAAGFVWLAQIGRVAEASRILSVDRAGRPAPEAATR